MEYHLIYFQICANKRQSVARTLIHILKKLTITNSAKLLKYIDQIVQEKG